MAPTSSNKHRTFCRREASNYPDYHPPTTTPPPPPPPPDGHRPVLHRQAGAACGAREGRGRGRHRGLLHTQGAAPGERRQGGVGRKLPTSPLNPRRRGGGEFGGCCFLKTRPWGGAAVGVGCGAVGGHRPSGGHGWTSCRLAGCSCVAPAARLPSICSGLNQLCPHRCLCCRWRMWSAWSPTTSGSTSWARTRCVTRTRSRCAQRAQRAQHAQPPCLLPSSAACLESTGGQHRQGKVRIGVGRGWDFAYQPAAAVRPILRSRLFGLGPADPPLIACPPACLASPSG